MAGRPRDGNNEDSYTDCRNWREIYRFSLSLLERPVHFVWLANFNVPVMANFTVSVRRRLTGWLPGRRRVAPSARAFARDAADDFLEHSHGRQVLGRPACEEPVMMRPQSGSGDGDT